MLVLPSVVGHGNLEVVWWRCCRVCDAPPARRQVTSTEVQDYISSFENKIGSFLLPLTRWLDDECKKNGLSEYPPAGQPVTQSQSNGQSGRRKLFTFPTCDFFWDSSFVVLTVRNRNQKVSRSYETHRRRYSTSKIWIIGLCNFRYPI